MVISPTIKAPYTAPARPSPSILRNLRPVLAETDTFTKSQAITPPTVSRETFEASLNEILTVSKANTLNPDTTSVLARLKPHFDVVENYFAQNRPANEVELTEGVWQQHWYKNPDIEDLGGPVRLRNDKIYQVVFKNFYLNVSEADIRVLGLKVGTARGFLRGDYKLTQKADAQNQGDKKLNVISLKFGETRSALGRLKEKRSIGEQVNRVLEKKTLTFKTPGPQGVEGELWNIYVDEKYRICRGSGGRTPNNNDQYYVLERSR